MPQLTYTSVRAALNARGLTITKKSATDEFRVNYKGGSEGTAYYTNDLEDAYHTGLAMNAEGMTPKDFTKAVAVKVPWRVSPRDYGERLAEWLNALGPDSAVYGQHGPHIIGGNVLTNLDVRKRWTDGNAHVRLDTHTTH